MSEERKFSDYIKARQALKEKLAKTGIAEDEYIALFELLDTVTGADLESIRDDQFADDAYDLAVTVQASTDKKRRQIGQFLRRFAEHVVRHVAGMDRLAEIQEIVDRLPQMTVDEEIEEHHE